MMDDKFKNMIAVEARAYMAKHGMSQARFSQHCKVSQAYISNILNGKFTFNANGKTATISDRIFNTISEAINMVPEKSFWRLQPTDQLVLALSTLEAAKKSPQMRTIIGKSGAGKTTAINQFLKAHPRHTYRVTITPFHTADDILAETCEAMGLEVGRGKVHRLNAIARRAYDIYLSGGHPLIAWDELENAKLPTIGLGKALYDRIHTFCSMAHLATPEYLDKLEKWVKKGSDGAPQYYRRVRAGIIQLPDIDRAGYSDFFEHVEDAALREFLTGWCSNYGELHDYLEPALKQGHTEGVPLTLDYFKDMFYISGN